MNFKMNFIEKLFYVIIAIGLAAAVTILALAFAAVMFEDHSISKYELGEKNNYISEGWVVVGVRNYWADDRIYFPKETYSIGQVIEIINQLNNSLLNDNPKEE